MSKLNVILERLGDDVMPDDHYPVLNWHPKNVEDIGLHIDTQTRWYIGDDAISNAKIARLFSTLLVPKDPIVHEVNQPYWQNYELRTPNIAFPVRVFDTPMLIVDFEVDEKKHELVAISNQKEVIQLPIENVIYVRHPIDVVETPVVRNKHGCWLRFNRQLSIEWALGEEQR